MSTGSALVAEREYAFIKEIHSKILASPNPEIAKVILYKMQYESPGWQSNNVLADRIGVPQEEVDCVLQFLEQQHLVRLVENDHMGNYPDWRWDVRRVNEVEPYLVSDLPFGPHEIINRSGLSDEQLLKAMNAVNDIVQFSYQKEVAFDLAKLRQVRDRTHNALEALAKQEQLKIHELFRINKGWKSGIPCFVGKADPTRCEGYDKSSFEFYGAFATPDEALRECFKSAIADPPIEDKDGFFRVFFLEISRVGDEKDKLVLNNPRYSAMDGRKLNYLHNLDSIIRDVQGRLERALS